MNDIFIPAHTAKGNVTKGEDITVLGSAAWDGGAQYRWGSYRERQGGTWTYWFCLLPSRRTDASAAVVRQLSMDSNGVLSLGNTGTAAAATFKSTREAAFRTAIIAFLDRNGPHSKTAIQKNVGGRKEDVLALIATMAAPGGDLTLVGKKYWTADSYSRHVAATATGSGMGSVTIFPSRP